MSNATTDTASFTPDCDEATCGTCRDCFHERCNAAEIAELEADKANKAGAKVLQFSSHPAAPVAAQLATAQQRQAQETKARLQAENRRLEALRASRKSGAKFERGRDITLVAKDIRRDIRAGIKAKRLPKGLKVSVRVERYSMGQAIHLEVKAAPGLTLHNDVFLDRQRTGKSWPPFQGEVEMPAHGMYTAEAAALKAKLEALVEAYNQNRSDPATDYYDSEFHANFRWAL